MEDSYTTVRFVGNNSKKWGRDGGAGEDRDGTRAEDSRGVGGGRGSLAREGKGDG